MSSTVALTQDLVRIPSQTPLETEAEIAEFVHSWLKGLSGVTVDRYEVQPGRTNVVARLESGSDLPALAVLAHMDTVPFGDGWTRSPTGGEIIDGRLYGRGACDMKSGLAVAMAAFAAAANSGQRPGRDLLMCATVDEEGSFMLGSNDLVDRGLVDSSTFVVATEPTDLEVVTCHKGLLWAEVQVAGKLAHAGNPQVGVDAIRASAEFVTRFYRAIEELPHNHTELGRPLVTFSHSSGGIKTNVVPDSARLELDIRLPPPMSIADAHAMVKACAHEVESVVSGSKISFAQMNNDRPPVETDLSSEIVAAFREAVKLVNGSSTLAGFPAYTDASVVQARTGNRSAVVFGPGRLAQAHTADEFVPVEQIDNAEAILSRVVKQMCFA